MDQNPNWKIIIGASGPMTEELKTLAEKELNSNQFEFIGFVDQVTNRSFYLKSKIWVSIPSSDGTAISLLEAMGYGCIPVVSDLPANREWVEDGVNGVIAENDLSNSIENALGLELEEVVLKNKNIIEEHGTKEANRKKFVQIYHQLNESKS